jgi:hypothetical protein
MELIIFTDCASPEHVFVKAALSYTIRDSRCRIDPKTVDGLLSLCVDSNRFVNVWLVFARD